MKRPRIRDWVKVKHHTGVPRAGHYYHVRDTIRKNGEWYACLGDLDYEYHQGDLEMANAYDPEFKVEQKVRCIDSHGCVTIDDGKTYTVAGTRQEPSYCGRKQRVRLKETAATYMAARFEKEKETRMGSDLLHGASEHWETFGQDEKGEEIMSDEKKPDHDYDPEKIRGAIQDRLYLEPEPLGDAGPGGARKVSEGVCVRDLDGDRCRIFFQIMGSWFSLDVDRERIEKEPTIAEQFVSGERKKYTGEVEIFPNHSNAVICFEDGSKARFYGYHWSAL